MVLISYSKNEVYILPWHLKLQLLYETFGKRSWFYYCVHLETAPKQLGNGEQT